MDSEAKEGVSRWMEALFGQWRPPIRGGSPIPARGRAFEGGKTFVFQLTQVFFGSSSPPETSRALDDETDPEQALEVARAHGVVAICHEALIRMKDRNATLSAAGELFLRERQLAAYRSIRTGRDLAQIVDAFHRAGILPVLLKGASLAFNVYPDPSLRPMGDLDLLVRKEDASKAQGALATLGYSPAFVAATRWEEENLLAHLPHQRAPGRIPVEIHFRLFPRAMPYFPDEEGLWDRVVWTTVEGRRALRLAPSDELLYLCGHLRKHAPSLYQLIWFCDVALLWRKMGAGELGIFFHLLAQSPRREEIEAVVRTARAWFLGEAVEAAHDLEAVMDSPLTVPDRDRPEALLRMEELLGHMPGWGPRVRFVAGYLFPRLSYIQQFHQVETRRGAWRWRLLRPFWVIGRAMGALRARRGKQKAPALR